MRCRSTRYTYGASGGGPIVRNKVFFFGSGGTLPRTVNWISYPDTGSAVVNQLLRDQEAPFDVPTRTSETRAFIKFDQQVGQHQLTQQVNYTDSELGTSCRCRRQRAALGAK